MKVIMGISDMFNMLHTCISCAPSHSRELYPEKVKSASTQRRSSPPGRLEAVWGPKAAMFRVLPNRGWGAFVF